ncbi:MAG: hypothetical protein IJO13_04040, partial [Lachnospiraceae bacterium]|nr:hypothetical protein [Lachnospiraceae bacterium]
MKKTLCIVLAVLMIVGLFSGCAREKEPLRICVDLDYVSWSQYHAADAMKIFLSRVKDLGGPEDVVLDVIPESGVERDTAITRLRTEIMAGEGPDLFIMACDDGTSWKAEALFPIPEKAMENGMFLSLDPYIEDEKFAQWDKLMPQVMAAGRDEYGQQIVPIAYAIPLTFYLESDVPEKPGVETAWQEMLEDKTDVLTAAASWYHTKALTLESEQDDHIEYALGELADYENEELLFTEEELLQRVREILELKKQWTPDMPPDVPVHYQTRVGISYDGFGSYSQTYADNVDPFNGIRPEDPKT